jgi:hypothetical protein
MQSKPGSGGTVLLDRAAAVVIPAGAATAVGVTAAIDTDVEGIAVLARYAHGFAGNLSALCLGAKAQVNAGSGVTTVFDTGGASGFA